MELKEANNEHADPEIYLEHEYEGVVGIFSEDFVEILRYLGEASDEAIINIRNGQVKFTTETDRNVIRRTERNECFIGGLGEEDEFEVNIDIPPLEAFRKASLVSTMVWVLFSDGVPLALNFPVDAIGNIMFYFA
ncbi:Proliferating cell nuclear antigen like [Melia azedarach]|uniref:Proliferating cell nuclear antigen like n=1 Tax=Melia azedarach TaxID=155640 RepID=A0ACC1YU47_MELAZ|nr:Proliferating cell nuclear antigen like [Melia azedarach]